MPSFNKVFLMGNLTRDPEVRVTTGGSPVTSFSIAVSRKFITASGGKNEDVSFFDVETWGKQAETCGKYLKKGSCVFVEGELRQDKWETKTGEKRSRVRVRGSRVQFISRVSIHEDEAGSAQPPEAPENLLGGELEGGGDGSGEAVPF